MFFEGRKRTPQVFSDEVRRVYSDGNVLAALLDCDWFNMSYILDVRDSEPRPEWDSKTGLADKFLAEFLQSGDMLEEDNELFKEFQIYLNKRMIGPQGHPYSIGNIPFADESFFEIAETLGVDKAYEVERGMIFDLSGYATCLVAPKKLRRKVVRQICSWGEGYDGRRRNVLLWAELAKRGAKQFLIDRSLEVPVQS